MTSPAGPRNEYDVIAYAADGGYRRYVAESTEPSGAGLVLWGAFNDGGRYANGIEIQPPRFGNPVKALMIVVAVPAGGRVEVHSR